jgi:hypothetical protein
LLNETLTE